MSIAQEFSLPKLAILKDRETARCSIHHIFHIVDVRYEEDGSAFWLRLDTRGGSIGADAQRIDLSYLSGLPIQDSSSKEFSRNAIWSRDELILALDLYIRHRGTSLAKDAPVIEELSQVLNELGIMLGTSNSRTYRNTNGVYMKLMNFRRLDPDYTASGRSGLTRGNSDEVRVWKLFAHDPVHLAEVAEFIRNGVLGYSKDVGIAERDESEIEEAEEGRVATRIHRYRERDPRLVKEAKARALKRHGRLVCAACNFDFSQSYGITGKGIIDVHHTKPVHTMRPGEKTKVADLVLLCSNCHRVVHSRRQWLTVAQIKSALCV
ncbi:HNH endonuclease [Bordetella petrii]|uniref:HNH endonuclease n=1 Tax=Bordetella petrii TaxID=94624 RepID=UPI001A96940B|nr:HNH endonuclease [Bordetella petrii]MBO1112588.1 HNH endonuclease [Bordetella petrii]